MPDGIFDDLIDYAQEIFEAPLDLMYGINEAVKAVDPFQLPPDGADGFIMLNKDYIVDYYAGQIVNAPAFPEAMGKAIMQPVRNLEAAAMYLDGARNPVEFGQRQGYIEGIMVRHNGGAGGLDHIGAINYGVELNTIAEAMEKIVANDRRRALAAENNPLKFFTGNKVLDYPFDNKPGDALDLKRVFDKGNFSLKNGDGPKIPEIAKNVQGGDPPGMYKVDVVKGGIARNAAAAANVEGVGARRFPILDRILGGRSSVKLVNPEKLVNPDVLGRAGQVRSNMPNGRVVQGVPGVINIHNIRGGFAASPPVAIITSLGKSAWIVYAAHSIFGQQAETVLRTFRCVYYFKFGSVMYDIIADDRLLYKVRKKIGSILEERFKTKESPLVTFINLDELEEFQTPDLS